MGGVLKACWGPSQACTVGCGGQRAVLWSSCVMTMKLSCHLRLIGLDQPTSGSKLTDPPSVFHCLSLSPSRSTLSLAIFLLPTQNNGLHMVLTIILLGPKVLYCSRRPGTFCVSSYVLL